MSIILALLKKSKVCAKYFYLCIKGPGCFKLGQLSRDAVPLSRRGSLSPTLEEETSLKYFLRVLFFNENKSSQFSAGGSNK